MANINQLVFEGDWLKRLRGNKEDHPFTQSIKRVIKHRNYGQSEDQKQEMRSKLRQISKSFSGQE